MNVAALAQLIGRTVALKEKGYAVFVTVTDIRHNYGRLEYEVVPVAGIGKLWVSADRTTLLD